MPRSFAFRSLTCLILACFIGCSKGGGGSSGPVAVPLIPAFETRIDLGTGAGQHADMVLADFTGDAIVDVVVVHPTLMSFCSLIGSPSRKGARAMAPENVDSALGCCDFVM